MRASKKFSVVPFALCAGSVLVLATGTATATAKKSHTPRVILSAPLVTSATDVSDNSVKLNGTLLAIGSTSSHFEYGTTGFTQTTSSQTSNVVSSLAITRTVGGLQPNTTYMWRLVADGSASATSYFTTAASNSGPGSNGSGSTPGGSGATNILGLINTTNPTPQASHSGSSGGSLVVDPGSSIDIRLPGSSQYVSLGSTASIPSGSTIKSPADEVAITSVDRSGTRQTGYFRGGAFKVTQNSGGYVQLALVGDYRQCGAAATHKTRGLLASAAKHKPASKNAKIQSLWGRDKGGKFRTKGHSSVATVRGTRWYTEDRCGGTLTKVTQGAVDVKPKHGKTTVVKAGKAFFAK